MSIESGIERDSASRKIEASGLINRLHDEVPLDKSDGALAGMQASLSDWKGHLARDSAGALAGFSIGKFGDVYSPFAKKVPWILASAVAITAISRAFEGADKEQHSNEYNLARFGTDTLATATAGLIAGRVAWGKEGGNHLEYLINRDARFRYVPAHKSIYGPKVYSFGSHYEHTGLTLREKTKDLKGFLADRHESFKFADAYDRMKAAHNPKLEGHVWTSRS